MLRDQFPAAWGFHVNTVRWPFNTVEPEDSPWAGAPFKEMPGAPLTQLPPGRPACLPLDEAVRRRASCRTFAATPLPLEDVSAILALAYGVHGFALLGAKEHLERPVPSGGGLYPLELYLIVRDVEQLEPGIYHYMPLVHALECVRTGEFSNAFISQLFMNQPYLAGASVILLLTAVGERSMHKYGDRGYRYILLEAGHAAQNVCLAAASLDLGVLPLGGFFDAYLAELLAIDYEEEPILYGLALGHPTTADRVAVRNMGALVDG